MKVGLLEKNIPMELQCVDKESGVYNIYAPGQIDIKWIDDLLDNPPEDCNFITVFSNDNSRNFDSLFKHFCDKRNIKWYRFERNNFVHYMADLHNLITEEMMKEE